VNLALFQRCRFGQCKTLRHERSVPGCQHDCGRIEYEPLPGHHRPPAVFALMNGLHTLAKVNGHVEGAALLHEPVDQLTRGT